MWRVKRLLFPIICGVASVVIGLVVPQNSGSALAKVPHSLWMLLDAYLCGAAIGWLVGFAAGRNKRRYGP